MGKAYGKRGGPRGRLYELLRVSLWMSAVIPYCRTCGILRLPSILRLADVVIGIEGNKIGRYMMASRDADYGFGGTSMRYARFHERAGVETCVDLAEVTAYVILGQFVIAYAAERAFEFTCSLRTLEHALFDREDFIRLSRQAIARLAAIRGLSTEMDVCPVAWVEHVGNLRVSRARLQAVRKRIPHAGRLMYTLACPAPKGDT